jgi:hypothetical protein
MKHTVETLAEFARVCGTEYAAGAVVSSNTLNSARVKALIPAMEAIEAGHITLQSDLPRIITTAYAAGAGIEYSGNSEKTAVNKTAQFLIAASKGFGTLTIKAVQEYIAGINDKNEKDKAGRGMFEKLVTIFNKSIQMNVIMEGAALRAFLLPVAAEKTKDELLAGMFDKAAKLIHEIAKLSDAYSGLAVTALQFERHSETHAAKHKRAVDQATPVSPLAEKPVSVLTVPEPETAVTSQSDAVAVPDTIDELLAP